MKKYITCILTFLACTTLQANQPMHAGLKICTVSATLNACAMPVEAGNEVVRIRFSEYPVEKGTNKIVCDYDNTNVTIASVKAVKGNLAKKHSIIVSDVKPTKGKLYIALKHSYNEKIKGSIDVAVTGDKAAEKHAVNISNCAPE